MQAAMLDVPGELLVERRRLGHDRFDEKWERVLHMVPPPHFDHQDIESWLVTNWLLVGEPRGLRVTTGTGLFDPAVNDFSSYRQPDVAVSGPEHLSERGIEGWAELVVEIRSPGDESYEKLPFYERVGVQELLIVELDLSLRHWARRGGTLAELVWSEGEPVALEALPFSLSRPGPGCLAMDGPAGAATFNLRAH